MLVAYAQREKEKSRKVLEAFAAGCGGKLASTDADVLLPGDCAFYGVRPGWSRLWLQAKSEGRNIYYLDNSFFDADRESKFRVAKNCIQQTVFPEPVGIAEVARWRSDGEHVVVCPQSTEFMRTVCDWHNDWVTTVTTALRKRTTRELRVRRKGDRRSLQDDLKGAWACVVHTSAAAVEALLAGVPVFCTGDCAALACGTKDLGLIESPVLPEGRERLIAQLRMAQWSLEQMARGEAWAYVNRA